MSPAESSWKGLCVVLTIRKRVFLVGKSHSWISSGIPRGEHRWMNSTPKASSILLHTSKSFSLTLAQKHLFHKYLLNPFNLKGTVPALWPLITWCLCPAEGMNHFSLKWYFFCLHVLFSTLGHLGTNSDSSPIPHSFSKLKGGVGRESICSGGN